MGIEAALGAKENLAVDAESTAGGNHLCDLFQLRSQAVVGGEYGLDSGNIFERFGEQRALPDRLSSYRARGLHHGNAGVEGEQFLHGLKTRAPGIRSVDALDSGSAAGTHGERTGDVTGAENWIAGYRQNRRELGARMESRADLVGHFSGPTGVRQSGKLRGLPLILLVGVREQILGQMRELLIILPRGGLHQSSYVGQDGQGLVGIEQRLQSREVGMEAKVGLAAGLQRQERALAEGQILAYRLVVGVARRVDGHNQIVGIVASKEEDAHQRFVVGGALRHGAYQSEFAEAADH